jgi:hypothetical protein
LRALEAKLAAAVAQLGAATQADQANPDIVSRELLCPFVTNVFKKYGSDGLKSALKMQLENVGLRYVEAGYGFHGTMATGLLNPKPQTQNPSLFTFPSETSRPIIRKQVHCRGTSDIEREGLQRSEHDACAGPGCLVGAA